MSYEDVAPNISQLATEAQFKASFPKPPPPPEPLPDPNADQKLELLMAYRDEYNSNGGAVDLRRLAKRVGVPLWWARVCDREVRAAIAEVY